MLYNYNQFNESNLSKKLKEIGYDKKQLPELYKLVGNGELGHFLNSENKKFTFGILNAIYLDSLKFHKSHEMKKGIAKAIVRAVPMVLSPISILVSIVGEIFGGSRAVGKILRPIIEDPGNTYPEFLKKIIATSVKIAEGEISDGNDPLKMAFVVSDGLVDMLSSKIVLRFTIYLSEKMSMEDKDKSVPEYYIENELRVYLNNTFSLNPPMSLKSNS